MDQSRSWTGPCGQLPSSHRAVSPTWSGFQRPWRLVEKMDAWLAMRRLTVGWILCGEMLGVLIGTYCICAASVVLLTSLQWPPPLQVVRSCRPARKAPTNSTRTPFTHPSIHHPPNQPPKIPSPSQSPSKHMRPRLLSPASPYSTFFSALEPRASSCVHRLSCGPYRAISPLSPR